MNEGGEISSGNEPTVDSIGIAVDRSVPERPISEFGTPPVAPDSITLGLDAEFGQRASNWLNGQVREFAQKLRVGDPDVVKVADQFLPPSLKNPDQIDSWIDEQLAKINTTNPSESQLSQKQGR